MPAALILIGQSAYNSLTVMSMEIARELKAMSIDPVIINLMTPQEGIATLNQAFNDYGPQGIIAAFSFSGMGIDSPDNTKNTLEENIWQKLHMPLFAWFLDHPAYYMLRHNFPAPATMRVYTTDTFLRFQRDVVRAPFRTARCSFGTFSYGREAQRRTPRKGETPLILLPKSITNIDEQEQAWAKLPKLMQRILHDSVDHYWDTTPRVGSVEASVLAAADAAQVDLRNDMPQLCFYIAYVDHYTRARKGNILLQDVVRLPVRIMGKGIERLDLSDAKAEIVPPIDCTKLTDVFHEALAIISMNPNVDDEGHDRIYSAFGCGALPISDINPWWEKNFPALQPYSYDFRDKKPSQAIERVLADPEQAAEVAWQEGSRMRAERPFRKAVEEAVELAKLHRFFTFEFDSPLNIFNRQGL